MDSVQLILFIVWFSLCGDSIFVANPTILQSNLVVKSKTITDYSSVLEKSIKKILSNLFKNGAKRFKALCCAKRPLE